YKDYAWQILRGVLVAEPVLWLGQRMLGSHRPDNDGQHPGISSAWNFFNDNHGISGHAVLGAIPFLLLAKEAQGSWKWFWYALSVLPAVARLFTGAHFPSQILLGWCLGYAATVAIMAARQNRPAIAGVS
ncbi:MAG: phosphatase PAP2 family protein, partial [Nevskiales bacterium]